MFSCAVRVEERAKTEYDKNVFLCNAEGAEKKYRKDLEEARAGMGELTVFADKVDRMIPVTE